MGRINARHTIVSEKYSYDMIIGEDILNEVSSSAFAVKADRCGICVSKNVLSLHEATIRSAFPSDKYIYFSIDDGELQKSFINAEKLLSEMLKAGFSRHSLLVAIGGGVVGDFAGFAASIYMRGIKIIQVPTTLLSMVDSSIGGKTAVNIGEGKNIAGVFHPPVMIAADMLFLETLPDDQWREGMAETVKHAAIGEHALYAMLEKNSFEQLKSSALRTDLVAMSAGFKVGIVSRDEKEQGERANLNFGHTIGHAIESAMHYKLSHGAAVGIGMDIIAQLCRMTGRLSSEEFESFLSLTRRYTPQAEIVLPDADILLSHMKYDKKNTAGSIRFVLLNGLFNPIYNVTAGEEDVRQAIREYQKSR